MGRLQLAVSLYLLSLCTAELAGVRLRAKNRLAQAKEDTESHRGQPLIESHRQQPLNESHISARPHNTSSGGCQHANWGDRLVVAARFDEDVSWMATYLVPWMPFLVYSISGDQAATHRTLSNTGREAQAYLQFIVDFYDCMPQAVTFIHAHRSSQHSPDMLTELKRLKWEAVPGFLSISRPQRVTKFYLSQPDKHKPAGNETSELAHWMEFAYQQSLNMQAAWPQLFQAELGDMPNELNFSCCGQFVATKKRILSHSKGFYQASLRWLQNAELDTFWAGLIFESAWSYIFGAGANYTPPPDCSMFACDSNGNSIVPLWESKMPSVKACRQASAQ